VLRVARVARSSAEQNHLVWDVHPRALWEEIHQIPLDLHGIVLRREREALAHASDMRIDEDAFRLRSHIRDDDVGRLARDAGQLGQVLDRQGYGPAELVGDLASGVTLLTVSSVLWADRIVEMSSSKGLR
jgi:hypothetical protein